jgi:hypothetical protein
VSSHAPQNLDAEERVLSALLLAGADGVEATAKAVAKVRSANLESADFFRQSHAAIYAVALGIADQGAATDLVTIAAQLADKLDNAGGKVRLAELFASATAWNNIGRHAQTVREAADRRRLWRELTSLVGTCETGGALHRGDAAAALDRAREQLDATAGPGRSFHGMSFAEACKAEIPPVRELVEGIVDAGTVGLIAGLPFVRKSFLAQALAHIVAAGRGELLGRYPVLAGGPVIYVWQDDSTAKELERIQLYASRHDYPETLPLRFVINEGIRIPDDLPSLRAMIEADSAVLVILDSLYNVLSPELGLKDESVALVLASVKQEICDATGATVAIVDHAAWPTESNRGQRRAYGSVFKTAAVRWAIHLEADSKDATRLHVEAKGNNVAGFKRCPARWDEETLEIHLLEPQPVSTIEHVRELLTEAGAEGITTSELEAATGKTDRTIRDALKKLPATKLQRLGSTGENPWVLSGDDEEASEEERLWPDDQPEP